MRLSDIENISPARRKFVIGKRYSLSLLKTLNSQKASLVLGRIDKEPCLSCHPRTIDKGREIANAAFPVSQSVMASKQILGPAKRVHCRDNFSSFVVKVTC